MFGKQKIIVPVEVSARHCHISKDDLEKIFGVGYQLEKLKQLSQPSDFACKETIDIELGNKKIERVRIVGPLRERTQVEVSLTDTIGSGVVPPIRVSGNISNSIPVILHGPVGRVELLEGLIIAQRHLHCSIEEAKKYNLKNEDIISIKVGKERSVIFENVYVRVEKDYKLSMQIDTDEGNAAGIDRVAEGIIIK